MTVQLPMVIKPFISAIPWQNYIDRNATSSRYNVLLKTMEFFGYDLTTRVYPFKFHRR